MKPSIEVASEWFAELPMGWSVIRIKHGFRLIGSGTTPPTGESRYYEGTVPWVTSSELRENVVCSTEKTLTTEAIEEFTSLKTYPVGTVLFAMYGATIGRVAILGIPATVNQAVCALAEPDRFVPGFVFYGLQASREFLTAFSSGGGQPNLNAEKVREHKLPCPNLESQDAIVDYLDRETARLDGLVAAKERALGLLAEKRRALITRAVTRGLDPTVSLRDSGIPWLEEIPVHWETRRVAWLFRDRDERGEPNLPLLEVSINAGVVLREFSDDRIESTASDFNIYKIARKGDVVFNKMRMWQGAVGVAPEDGLVSPDYTVAAPSGALSSDYAEQLFRTEMFSAECARWSHGIVWDRLRLYWEGFRDIEVPLPSLSEQRAIVAHISTETVKLDALREATERTIGLLKERRAALIAAAVTGKLDVSQNV